MATTYEPPAYLRAIDPSEVRMDLTRHQPAGGHGFRKGHWTVIYQGTRYRILSAPSHSAEIAAQHRIVAVDAARALGLLFHDLDREG